MPMPLLDACFERRAALLEFSMLPQAPRRHADVRYALCFSFSKISSY
jgi:hypothetical protein